MKAFIHGLILAAGLILPLGVQNLFVLSQGMVQPRFWQALPAAVTAAVCDTLLIIVAVQGVSMVLLKFGMLKILLLISGIIFLAYMGYSSWYSSAGLGRDGADTAGSLRRQVLFAVTVSLLNPYAVLDIVAVIGASSVGYEGEEKLYFAVACILVSWCWFLALVAVGCLLGKRSSNLGGGLLNKISALIMWGTAMYLTIILAEML